MKIRLGLALALVPLGGRLAEAHIVASRLGDFYTGALHPLSSVPDVLPWLALGVLAGLQPASRARWLVPLFPAGLLAGLGLGLWAGAPPALPLPDAAALLLLGGLLAGAARLPGPVLWAMGFFLAVLRGLAGAGSVTQATDATLFAAGFALAGYAAVTLTMALAAVAAERAWPRMALRAGGVMVAGIAVLAGTAAVAG